MCVDILLIFLEIVEDFIKCIEDYGLKDDVELKRGKF